MNPERSILIFIDWFLPGYKAGGPIRSCVNLVAHLKEYFNIRVVTGDTDLDETRPYKNIVSDNWNKLPDGTLVYYLSAASKKYKNIREILLREKFDVLYLNSFFSVSFTLFPLLIVKLNHIPCKVVVAPRGMMGKGSLAIKPLKKKIFIRFVKMIGLFEGVTWHASTPDERMEISGVFGKRAVIKNAINLTAPGHAMKVLRKKEKGRADFFCLARISQVKNILAVFRYFSHVDPGYHFKLHLFGTIEDNTYLDQCKAIASGFGKNIEVEFRGPLENDKVRETASRYHFMILPTLNENFGHAIVESFMAGCPVLISDRTPWKNLEAIKAGWDLSLNDDGPFIQKINLCASMSQEEYDSWSEGASGLGEKIVNNEEAVLQNRDLFL